jgi:serine/threonine-protein kinase
VNLNRAGIVDRVEARVGTELAGCWHLDALIGAGGSAAVYRGLHRDGRVGAVKVMHAHLECDSRWIRRLEREARLLHSLRHPGLVPLLDFGYTSDGAPFLVMELLEGRSLEALRRERGGTLGVAESIRHTEALLEVLEHTHGLGVTHRDLKPSNLFLTEGGALKVVDFGIATAAADERLSGTESVTRGILGNACVHAAGASERSLGPR